MNGGFGDIVFFKFFVKRAAADPESGGSFFFVPIAFNQDFFEQIDFIFYN
jgi:hypothetical protein